MSWVLLSNDDGVDSPALLPFADALEQALGLPVHVCVPDGERSWSSKAVTRYGDLSLRRERRGGRMVAAVDGTPADAVQLGLYGVFAAELAGVPPTVVVTGINLGLNHGRGYLCCSGTVWAAAEAALAGIPAIAVSTGSDDHAVWKAAATSGDADADAGWRRIAAVAAATVRAVGDSPVHDLGDLTSVNVPWPAELSTPRRLTGLAPISYGPLFRPASDDDGRWTFVDAVTDDRTGAGPDDDVTMFDRGAVTVTPVLLPRSAAVPDDVRDAFDT